MIFDGDRDRLLTYIHDIASRHRSRVPIAGRIRRTRRGRWRLMGLLRTIRNRRHRGRYLRHLANEEAKINRLADSALWHCKRCDTWQSSKGRWVRKYWEGSNYGDDWPSAHFVAMDCEACGTPITKSLPRWSR